jgi:O-antigen ligase
VVSTLFAIDMKRAILVTLFTIFVVVMAWTISLRFEPDQLGSYVRIIVISALVACAFGFYQFFGDLIGIPTSLTGLRDAYTKKEFLGFPRIQSTALEPLYFANYLLLPISLSIVVYLFRRSSYVWALIPLLVCLWLTVSRGAFGAVTIILFLMVVIGIGTKRIKQVGVLVAVALATIGIALGLIALGTTIDAEPTQAGDSPSASEEGPTASEEGPTPSEEGPSASEEGPSASESVETFSGQSVNTADLGSRGASWNMAIQAFREHPVLGIGPGNFGDYVHNTMPSLFASDLWIVNNETLEILAETGIIGFVCFSLFAFSLLWLTIKRLAKRGIWEQPLLLGLLVCLVGYAAQYQFFSTLYITHIWLTIGLVIGYLFARPVSDEPVSQKSTA